MKNYDDFEFQKFTTRSQADKAINSLKGLLLGIKLDSEVNVSEIKELESWCSKHKELINRNPFREFMTIISASIAENSVSIETIEDLYWLCQKYEHDSVYYNAVTSDLQTLQGICHGIISDSIIRDAEIVELDKWLDENEHLTSYYPYDEIKCLVTSILSDGKIDEEERRRLLAYFNEFSDITSKDLAVKIDSEIAEVAISGICTVSPNVIFPGKIFCFTGVAKRAPRKELEKVVAELGGIFSDTLTNKTDYLIVGDNGNPCWAFACYGRKVEKAVELRKSGKHISIVHEFDFWDFVEDHE